MHLRVVGDQPWDVSADVLVVPTVGEPRFEGALAEMDKRAGGELSALTAFGDITKERYCSTVSAGGQLRADRILTIGAGAPEKITRQVIVRMASAVERRLAGRTVRRLVVDFEGLVDKLVRHLVLQHFAHHGPRFLKDQQAVDRQCSRGGIHCGLPQLLAVHFAQTFVTLHFCPLVFQFF